MFQRGLKNWSGKAGVHKQWIHSDGGKEYSTTNKQILNWVGSALTGKSESKK